MHNLGTVAAISTASLLVVAMGGSVFAHSDDDVESGAAAGTTVDGITVEGVWSRPSPVVEGVAAAYMTLRNGGDMDDALISGTSSAAATVELHQTTQDAEGMMSMSPVEAIMVPAHGETLLEPGGYHLMLIDLVEPLIEGDSIDLTLVFQQAGSIEVSSMVMAMDAGGPMHDMDDSHVFDGDPAVAPTADPTASFPAEPAADD